jgi:ABC-type lipoprotein export system ATPase subunit
MIKTFEVKNLNEKISGFYTFNSDLNILTGKNGSGKTTLLKLLWYMVSGNFDKIFEEMYFDYAEINFNEGARIVIEIYENEIQEKHIRLTLKSERMDIDVSHEVPFDQYESLPSHYHTSEGSLFFPTFRRIEGGFSVDSNNRKKPRYKRNQLREALDSISDNLSSSSHHKFIASLSTEDIDYLLSNKYANISEEVRRLEANQSKNILNIVANSDKKEKDSLEKIRKMVKLNEVKKNEILRPFNVLSSLINKIFKEKSIKISANLELGKAKQAIFSNKLSAGEKQMLSFLCYNFFFDNSVIFIDEPELSLHTDWQRLLFPTLLKQKKDNQFIIATHSPFIYSKYEEKEIIINQEKGNLDG